MKTCRTCKEVKDPTEFYGKDTQCKECVRAYQKARREGPEREWLLAKKRDEHKRNREAVIDRNREKRFGLTREQYDEMLIKQGGGCAICKSLDPKGKHGERFAVDHCHKTGKVRGLLCNSCNLGLGHLADDLELVLQAADYLRAAQ